MNYLISSVINPYICIMEKYNNFNNTSNRFGDIDFKYIDNVYTQARKHSSDQAWFKAHIDYTIGSSTLNNNSIVDGMNRMLSDAYYDKFNSLDMINHNKHYKDILGLTGYKTNKRLLHRDILSPKIKVVEGMESWKNDEQRVHAINASSTTRREKKRTDMLMQYVKNFVMEDAMAMLEQQKAQALSGKDLTADEISQIEQQMAEQMKSMTPDEIDTYFARTHSEPEEAQANQLARFIKRDNRWSLITSEGFRYGLLYGSEVYLPRIENKRVKIDNIPSDDFWFEHKHGSPFVHDASKQVSRRYFSVPELVNRFKLDRREISKLKDMMVDRQNDSENIRFDFGLHGGDTNGSKVRCYHAVWRAIVKIGFLTYYDAETGELSTMKVNDEYKMRPNIGDLSLEWEYIFMPFEGWLIGGFLYKDMKMCDSALLDSDDLWSGAMPYVGVVYDSDREGTPTSLMKRGLEYQLMYDVFYTKLHELIKSDKGKKLFMDSSMISSKLGTKKFMSYLDSENIGLINPSEEGNRGLDVTNGIKVVDLSLASDIQKMMLILEFVDKGCGDTMGVNKQMEGSIGKREAVFNTKQNITQSSHILAPIKQLHSLCKDVLLDRSLELGKLILSESDEDVTWISNVMDDMSVMSTKIDNELITNNNFGVFSDSTGRGDDIYSSLVELSHAAMQTQVATFSDVARVLRAKSIYEAEEILEAAERRNDQRLAESQQAEAERAEKSEQASRAARLEEREHEKELIRLEASEKREGMLHQQTIESMGFADNKDADNDGVPDVFEVYKHGIDTDLKSNEQNEDMQMNKHQIEMDKARLKLDKRKLDLEELKIKKMASKSKT